MDDNTKLMLFSLYYQLAYADLLKKYQENNHRIPDNLSEIYTSQQNESNKTERKTPLQQKTNQYTEIHSTDNISSTWLNNNHEEEHYEQVLNSSSEIHAVTKCLRKSRTTFTQSQMSILENEFLRSCYISTDKINSIANATGLNWRIIKVKAQN
jgi:hypothetical protein